MTKRRIYHRMLQLKDVYKNINIDNRRISNTEQYKKNNNWINIVNKKKEEKRKEIEENMLRECSFQPKIISNYTFNNNIDINQKEKITYYRSKYTNMKLSFLERTHFFQQFQKERIIQIKHKYNNTFTKKRRKKKIINRKYSIYDNIPHKIDNTKLTNGRILLKKLEHFQNNITSEEILRQKESVDMLLSSIYLIIQENKDLDLL